MNVPNPTALLGDLEDRGIRLYLADGQLRALAPKHALTSNLAGLVQQHRDSIVALLKERQHASALSVAPRIGIADRTSRLSLSFAQQRLWFLSQLDPSSVEYNMPMPVWWEGDIDAEALGAALNALAERHEVLRTRLLTDDDGVAYQQIEPPGGIELPVIDVTGESEPATAARRVLAEDAARPFDLAAELPLRAKLVKVSENESMIALCLHHVVFDEWSSNVFRRELFALYEACRDGRDADLPPLSVQYADFAVWQREWLSGETLERQLEFWRSKLVGAPTLELPTDRPRPRIRSSAGGSVEFELPAQTVDGLRQLSRRAGCSMFMTMLGVVNILLARYSGQDDIVIGTPIANRNRVEVEGLIGFFVNALALRTDLSGDPTFEDLLGRIRESALEAYAHQDLPFEHLVQSIETERDRSRTPIFQVIMSYAQGGQAHDSSSMGPVAPADGDEAAVTAAKFDLAVTFGETATGGLAGGIQYATSLFDRDRIERMVGHLRQLLATLVAAPRQRLSQIDLLTSSEHSELAIWSHGRASAGVARDDRASAERPVGVVAHQLIERFARTHPDALALRCAGESLTFSQLDSQASRLAHLLRANGVTSGQLVGLCLPRSLELFVAMVAIWKAGAGYVPLDPEYPADRLAYLVSDCGAKVVLGNGGTASSFAEAPELSVGVIDLSGPSIRAQLAAGPDSTPEVRVSAGQIAYLIYTSGSTGRPKGVLVSHRGVVNLANALRPVMSTGVGVTALQFASVSFDAAVLDLAAVLCNGGALAVAVGDERTDVDKLARMIDDGEVAVASVVPSLLRMVDPSTVPGVRTWVTGAERLTAALARTWSDAATLVNTYGPTENTVLATVGRTEVTESGTNQDPPVGSPLPGVEVQVLDASLRPVPVGVTGEICIGGDGLALGYLGRPAQTAWSFVANPLRSDGSRLYRSGDLGRWRTDGQLEFVGRADRQVKIRGFRIEPGEIEHALLTHPDIAEAVVIADQSTGGPRLVAYVVGAPGPVEAPPSGNGPPTGSAQLAPGAGPSPGGPSPRSAEQDGESTGPRHLVPPVDRLRAFLGERLPEYMVPALFVSLESIPLGPTGKVDVAALPSPDESRLAPATFAAPRNLTEQLLAGIWAEVMGLERVSVTDSFFEIGGHSLLATQVLTRIRGVLGIDLPLAALFDRPTIAGLAEEIASRMTASGTDSDGLEDLVL